ncbi:MAG: hypothetical protein ABSB61_04865 [Anaerolineales bacterium]|jgi:hypothetical protein
METLTNTAGTVDWLAAIQGKKVVAYLGHFDTTTTIAAKHQPYVEKVVPVESEVHILRDHATPPIPEP